VKTRIALDKPEAGRRLIQRVLEHVEQLTIHPEKPGRCRGNFATYATATSSSRLVACFTAMTASGCLSLGQSEEKGGSANRSPSFRIFIPKGDFIRYCR
jgi:hypothetical protein